MRIKLFFIILFFSAWSTLIAQEITEEKQISIFETLEKPDSLTRATVKVFQDNRIEKLIEIKKQGTSWNSQTTSGYRIQVFSSSAVRTAKSEAYKAERKILDAFPTQTVYVNYISPYWKVRVGDFKTQAEAQQFRDEILNHFPALRSETYLVKEQVLLSGSK